MTYYELLNIKNNATIEEIKKAYREKVLLFHPDVNKQPNAENIFISIQGAYKILSDTEKRRKYDAALRVASIFEETRNEKTYQNQSKHNYSRNATADPTFRHDRKEEKSQPRWIDQFFGFLIVVGFFGVISFIVNTCSDSKKNNYSSYNHATNEIKEINDGLKTRGYPAYSINDESTQNKYYIDNKGNMRVVPTNRINAYQEKYPNSRLATNEEIFKVESRKSQQVGDGRVKTLDKKKEKQDNKYYHNSLKTGDTPYKTTPFNNIFDKKSLSKITLINGTSQDVIVTIYRSISKDIIRCNYISAFATFTMDRIPEGIFKMKCYYGEGWNPELDNGRNNPLGGFTRNVSFTDMANDNLDMIRDNTSTRVNFPTYEVTLHKVQNGNLQTKNINKNDFFK